MKRPRFDRFVRRTHPGSACRYNVVTMAFEVTVHHTMGHQPALGRGDTKARAWREAAKAVRARRAA